MTGALEHPGARHITPLTEGRRNAGREISNLARAFGRPPMPWQAHLYALTSEELEPGVWAYDEIITTVPRRGGKTAGRLPIAFHRALTKPGCSLWLTAQTRQDARDIIVDDVGKVVKRAPAVLRRAAKLRRSQGSEGWHFTNGSSWRVFAPNDDALHGKDSELVDVDEGWAFTAVEGAAITQGAAPTMLTTGGQVAVFSTMGTAESVWFHGLVDKGIAALNAGKRTGTAIVDMGLAAELVPAVRAGLEEDVDSPPYLAALETIARHHPAWGHTITRLERFAAVASMLKRPEEARPSPDAILRALGNVPTETAASVIPSKLWRDLIPESWPRPAAVTLAVAVGIDGSDAAIMAGWQHAGTVYVDRIAYRPGTAWVKAEALEVAKRWGMPPVIGDLHGPAADVLAELIRAGLHVVPITSAEYASSCAGLLSSVTEGSGLAHPGDEHLDAAAANAAKRRLGDGAWAWSRLSSSASIACLEGATLARWGALNHQPMAVPFVGVESGR